MEYRRKTQLTIEQLMDIDFEAEYGKLNPSCWAEGLQAAHVKQAASAQSTLRFHPMNSGHRQYYRHVMEEATIALEHFKKTTCPRCGKRLQESVPVYRENVKICSCGEAGSS